MAARVISSVNPPKKSQGFAKVLASAVLEWFLIFMLFIEATFSYLITKFSRYCDLQTPCLLCSRLDHVWGNENLGYYWGSICGNHKLEISSLVLCHVHNKRVNVHGMCESCLFSCATINKSDAETYRLLMGKLGEDSSFDIDQDPLLEGHELASSSARCCSRCNELLIARGYAQNLMATKLNEPEAAELDLPLSVSVGHNQDDEMKRRDNICVSVRTTHPRNSGHHPMSHVEYTELKITSDTESKVLYSDNDDDASALICKSDDPKEDLMVQCIQLEPHFISLADDSASGKLIDPASAPEPSLLASQVQSDVIEPHGGTSVASTAVIGHGLEELNWQQVECKADPPSPIELISLDDAPPSSNAMESPFKVSKESLDGSTGEVGQTSVTEPGDICNAGSGPTTAAELGSEAKPISSETRQQVPTLLDLGDAYKLAAGNRGRQLSGVLARQWSEKDSSKVSEDLKLLLSQISASRFLEQSTNDMSPRVSGNTDELRTSDASNSTGLQILQKRITLERNESGLSLDGSIVNEIEGESTVDRLKRQIDHDRKAMSSLYKELEEERNASAIAANQAMAMITRLQEEKAALHMEALQCLRMMEEQAEYDMEALQQSNDLLAEKEKAMQDLEAELEFYRKLPNESMVENSVEPACDLRETDIEVEQSAASIFEDSANVPGKSVTEEPNICDKGEGTYMSIGDKNMGAVNNSLLEFEDERLYILKCLKKLEKKLNLFSNDGTCAHLASGEYTEDEVDRVSDLKELDCEGWSQETIVTNENDPSMQIDISPGCLHAEEGNVSSSESPQNVGKENRELNYGGEGCAMASRGIDLVSLGNEVHYLNDRLKTLEADQNFIEHAVNSLRKGRQGLQFIEEIASHLRDLRRIGIMRRDQTAA